MPIDLSPNDGMKAAAERGLDYRRKYGRGGTPVGIARARDIKNGKTLSPATVRRMKAFFDRHEGNRVPPSDKKESDGGPTNGWIAWLLWGGDAGRTWAEAKVRQLNAAEDRVKIKRGYRLSEEEKQAFSIALEAMKKLMAEGEEPEQMSQEAEEERPYDEEGNKIEEESPDEETRWLEGVVAELRSSK